MELVVIWLIMLLFTTMTVVEPQTQFNCSCSVDQIGWSCYVEKQGPCFDSTVLDNAVERSDHLKIINLDAKHGKINGDFYYPKPTVTWVVTKEELKIVKEFVFMYYSKINDKNTGSYHTCYKIRPNVTDDNVLTTESNITISMDCLDYLGGEDKDAALVRVYSVSQENSGVKAWRSHAIIDALKKGIPVDNNKTYQGETVMMIRNVSCPQPHIVLDLRQANSTSEFTIVLMSVDKESINEKDAKESVVLPQHNGYGRTEFEGDHLKFGTYYIEVRDKGDRNFKWIESTQFDLINRTCHAATPVPIADPPQALSTTSPDRGTKIIFAALGAVGGVIIVIIVVLGFLIERHRKMEKKNNQPLLVPPQQNISETPNLERPSVYIIYYADDEYHKKVVSHFAVFLKQLGCDVRMDLLDAKQIMNMNKPAYVAYQWRTASYILMINSKGAYKSFIEETETSTTSSPTDGTFLSAMGELQTWAFVKEKRKEWQVVAFVNFGYTEKEYRVFGERPQFLLMKHMEDLLGLLYRQDLQVDNSFKNTEYYKNLTGAIESAERFYKRKDNERLDSGVGPSMDEETHQSFPRNIEGPSFIPPYEETDNGPSVRMNSSGGTPPNNFSPSRNDRFQEREYPSQFHGYMSNRSNATASRLSREDSLSPGGSRISRATVHFHAPEDHSSNDSLEINNSMAAVHEPLLRSPNQRKPENVASVRSQISMFPHNVPEDVPLTSGNLDETGVKSYWRPSATGPPSRLSSMSSPGNKPASPCMDDHIAPSFFAPSETDVCSSIHSSDQELAMQRINIDACSSIHSSVEELASLERANLDACRSMNSKEYELELERVNQECGDWSD